MRRDLRIGIILLLVIAAVVSLVSVLLIRAPKSAPWFVAVSSTNGYEALVQAAGQMKGSPPGEKEDPSAFVKANEPVFKQMGSALTLPFELPLSTYSPTNPPLKELASFKTVALALRAKGKEAEKRRADAEAAAVYMEIIRLGQHVEHGTVIALLSGIAIEKIGLDAVEKVAPRLTAAQRKDLADQLDSFDKQRLPFSEVTLREHYFARRITGNPIKLLIFRYLSGPAMQKAEQKEQRISSDFQRLAKILRLPPSPP